MCVYIYIYNVCICIYIYILCMCIYIYISISVFFVWRVWSSSVPPDKRIPSQNGLMNIPYGPMLLFPSFGLLPNKWPDRALALLVTR